MEKLKRKRLMAEQAWWEKRDAVLTMLLNKLINENNPWGQINWDYHSINLFIDFRLRWYLLNSGLLIPEVNAWEMKKFNIKQIDSDYYNFGIQIGLVFVNFFQIISSNFSLWELPTCKNCMVFEIFRFHSYISCTCSQLR